LAGSELGGVEHAREDLFDGATWYLVPTPRSSGVLLDRLYRFVSDLGARPVTIDAGLHDRLMATVSHLPHVVANVLVEQAAALGEALVQAALHTGPTRELRVPVPNRPGVVAELTLALGRAGINISDMSLTPAPDNTRGEIALWVPEADYERAQALVREL